jgi:plasmid stability protein
MARLNLTLDTDTFARLDRHAKQHGSGRASFARRILREGLDAREALERRKKLAADYAAGRPDAVDLLRDLEAPQLEWFDEED